MSDDVQNEVIELWEKVSSENLTEIGDIAGFREEFLRHHGFGIQGIDYSANVAV